MGTLTVNKGIERMPFVFDDYFKPWNEWFDNGNSNLWGTAMNIPAVNITEHKDEYEVSLAVPGMKKDDFKIDVAGNMLTISSEKEEKKEEEDKKFTRKEYNYSSFSRSFTLPEEINREKINAKYDNGILKISLPRKEAATKLTTKKIAVK
ncbi:MAG: Hsp20/alpha crystallin family protein [Chitinophagaceae bacterium]|nr:Hsp20/alpha crystallin family protein [Chitinophagaceae bacterium]